MVISYFLNTKYINNNFSVPNVIVDEFIQSADGNAIKVLLTILRNAYEVPSLEQLSLKLGLSMESIKNALKFWSDNKVITIVDGSTKQSNFKNYKAEMLQPSVMLQMSEDDKNVGDILKTAQQMCNGNQISQYEMSSLISAYSYLGMPKDVILALYSDCKCNNINMKTFDSIISRWASMGVNTLEEANKYLHSEQYGRNVAKIFKLQYLLPAQQEMVSFWNANDFPLELVEYLYNKYASNESLLPKANIRYINAIICDWISKGINTLEKVKQYEKNLNPNDNYINDDDKPSYNLDAYIDNLHKYY